MNIDKARQYDYDEERVEFTERQKEIAYLLPNKSHEQIGEDLGISSSTVNSHSSRIEEITSNYVNILTVMCKNLSITKDEEKFRQLAHTVQNASKEFENIDVEINRD